MIFFPTTPSAPDFSLILPCHNEEAGLDSCLREAREALSPYSHEIIVSDSSTDRSPQIALNHGVRLIKHDRLGYGNAYRAAFSAAAGRYILMADADGSYDFGDLPILIQKLLDGYDLVIGNRFSQRANGRHMPFWHRSVGNPVLSFLINRSCGSGLSDTQSGLRAMKRDTLLSLGLSSPGMEFASEMVLRSAQAGLRITEVPVRYRARIGQSKLRPITDGLRHLWLILNFAASRFTNRFAPNTPMPGLKAPSAQTAESLGR